MTPRKFDFFGDEAGGILEDPEHPMGAAGDPDAIADLQQENYVPPVAFGRSAEDGLPMPMAGDQREPGPARVGEDNFVCLTCHHYLEMIADVDEVDGQPVRETIRHCTRIRSWAETTDLAEAEIFACSLHTHEARRTTSTYPGLCAKGPCAHYAEMEMEGPLDGEHKVVRWCLRLAGAARLFDLRERLVEYCSGFQPPVGLSVSECVLTHKALLDSVKVRNEVRRDREKSE